MMRVQCDVCEKAVAQVVCCADEAALCLACDQRVHAANKLASKHHRLRLLPNHPLPLCDICQEKAAFIFCVEDRALVCRTCDVCIHAANTLTARHQRFLASGVRVALDSADEADASVCKPGVLPPSNNLHDIATSELAECMLPINKPNQTRHIGEPQDQVQNSFNKYLEEWQNPQSLSFPDSPAGYPPTADIEFAKTDLSLLSEDWMMDLGLFDEHVYVDSPVEVPQASITLSTGSAHTARTDKNVKGKRQDVSVVPDFDDVCVVPDVMPCMAPVLPLKRQKIALGN